MKNSIVWLLCSVMIFFHNSVFAAPSFKVGMILYRGMTEAEKGFIHYLEKKQVSVQYIIRDCEEDPKKLPLFVEEMKKLRPNLIYTFGTTATLATVGQEKNKHESRFIQDIPVVFSLVADPMGAGIVSTLESSHRNVTGVLHLAPLNTQLKALQSVGAFKKIAVLYSQNEKNARLTVEQLKTFEKAYGFSLTSYPVQAESFSQKTPSDALDKTLKQIIAARPDLVYLPSDSFMINHAEEISIALKKARIPSFSATESPIREQGILMGVVSTYYNVGSLAGYLAEQILVHHKAPHQLPISALKEFSFLINMNTAHALQFYPPIQVLRFAQMIR